MLLYNFTSTSITFQVASPFVHKGTTVSITSPIALAQSNVRPHPCTTKYYILLFSVGKHCDEGVCVTLLQCRREVRRNDWYRLNLDTFLFRINTSTSNLMSEPINAELTSSFQNISWISYPTEHHVIGGKSTCITMCHKPSIVADWHLYCNNSAWDMVTLVV